ncbi:MAG: hypothetical protein RPU94_09315, partial [Candidatus Sedimenticola sp. (ex Thyasira tokunagai)]
MVSSYSMGFMEGKKVSFAGVISRSLKVFDQATLGLGEHPKAERLVGLMCDDPHGDKRVFDFVMQNGTSESPFCTQSSTAYYCPGRPGLQHYAITSQARYCF